MAQMDDVLMDAIDTAPVVDEQDEVQAEMMRARQERINRFFDDNRKTLQ